MMAELAEPTEPGEYIRYEGEWVKLLSTPIFDGRWRYFTEDLSFDSTFPLEVLWIPKAGWPVTTDPEAYR